MLTGQIPFGKVVVGRIEDVVRIKSMGTITTFIGDDGQGYLIMYVDHDLPVGPAMIRFTEGGPLGGYWQPLPLTIGKG